MESPQEQRDTCYLVLFSPLIVPTRVQRVSRATFDEFAAGKDPNIIMANDFWFMHNAFHPPQDESSS